jgi:hypothetical protein
MQANKLALNRDKTQLMILARRTEGNDKLKIKNANPDLVVRPVNSIVMLGITISSDLKWNNYLQTGKSNLIQQLKKRNTMLRKVCNLTNKENRIKIANGIFASKLLYGIETWGSAPNYLINKVQSQKTAAMHIVHGTESIRWNRTRLLKETNWFRIDLIIQMTSAKLTQKILNGKGPDQLTEMMAPPNIENARITRSTKPGKLGTKPISLGRTNYTKFTYRNPAYSHYQNLPSELTDIRRSKNFSKRLKIFLINNDDLSEHRCLNLNCQDKITCQHYILLNSTQNQSSST